MKLKRETPKLRAEELRTRRSSGTKRPRRFDAVAQGGILGALTPQRGDYPAHRASAPSPSRPVTVRNTSFGTPIHRQVATANPRRAYYVPLDSTGAEVRLPSLPVIRPGWRLLSAAIAIAAGIGLFSVIFSPFFRVGQVAINGQERLARPWISRLFSTWRTYPSSRSIRRQLPKSCSNASPTSKPPASPPPCPPA